jgi:hypothetical protein
MMKHQNIEKIPVKSGLSRSMQKILNSRCFLSRTFFHKYFRLYDKVLPLFQTGENQHLYFKNVGFLFLMHHQTTRIKQ